LKGGNNLYDRVCPGSLKNNKLSLEKLNLKRSSVKINAKKIISKYRDSEISRNDYLDYKPFSR
jgi:hypothetical protein